MVLRVSSTVAFDNHVSKNRKTYPDSHCTSNQEDQLQFVADFVANFNVDVNGTLFHSPIIGNRDSNST